MTCTWKDTSPENRRYHDTEWGVPTHDDRKLFEYLVLETMQCGLSWDLIIRRREIMRACLDNFDPEKIARYTEEKIAAVLATDGMLKNTPKVRATVENAKHFLEIQNSHGSFDNYLWQYTGGKTLIIHRQPDEPLPTKTTLSEKLSKDLKSKDFKFFGPVVAYSYLEACGLINDHDPSCPRFAELTSTFPTEKI